MLFRSVDTCVLNKLVDGLIGPEELPGDGSFVASHVQIDEINKTKNEERRARLFLKFATVIEDLVPTESAVIGVSRIGHAKIGDANLYERLKEGLDKLNQGKKSNIIDALIAEVAIKNDFVLLTADYHLQEVAQKHGCSVICWPSGHPDS